MLQKAFGDETMSQKMFTNGTEILKKADNMSMICNAPDDHRLLLMTETSRKLCLEIRQLVDMVGISFGSVQTILKDHLGLRRVKSCLVPKYLNFFEKERRVKHVKQFFLTIKASTNKLLLAMNLGFMLTIQKQLTNQVNIV